MFNLDKAIAEWRRRMQSAGVNNPEILDELENHLREDVARREQSGVLEQQAFEASVCEIGEADAIKSEFRKMGGRSSVQYQRFSFATTVLLVLLILYVCGETIMHLQMALEERISAFSVVALILAATCSWRFVLPLLPVAFVKQKLIAAGPACGFYLKASIFLMPAAFVWLISVLFVIPKLREVCLAAGGMNLFDLSNAPILFIGWAKIGQALIFLTEHYIIIAGTILLGFVILERYLSGWKRYRRATVGTGIFVFNFAVLLTLTMMVISALIASSALMNHVK